jgi:outer membrane protein assembly factor BamB
MPPSSNPQSDFAVAYQLNAAHSGSIDMSEGFSVPLKQAWSLALNAGGLANLPSFPLVADGLVFVSAPTNEGGYGNYGINLATGKIIWSVPYLQMLTYDKGTVFGLRLGGQLTAYASTTGAVKWSRQLPQGGIYGSNPTAADGKIFVNFDDGFTVSAINQANGAIEWTTNVTGGNSGPAYAGGNVYVTYTAQYYSLKASNGAINWHDNDELFGSAGSTPVYDSGRLFTMDYILSNVILDAKTGQLMGSYGANFTPAFMGTSDRDAVSVAGDQLYGYSLYCWNLATANLKWKFTGDGQFSAPPIVVNGLVVAGSASGKVYVLNAQGKLLWSANTGQPVTSLAAGQGSLIVVGNTAVTAYVPQ